MYLLCINRPQFKLMNSEVDLDQSCFTKMEKSDKPLVNNNETCKCQLTKLNFEQCRNNVVFSMYV